MEYIQLLDCNRLQSTEYKSGNNNTQSIFTNEFKSGIKVDIGDKISLHNAYISETGSEEDSIQITDKLLETREITYTKQTPITYINACGVKPLGYERITASNVTETVEVKSNEFHILYNYYITNHGENCVHLPRRYAHPQFGSATDWDEFDIIAAGRTHDNHALATEVNASQNGYNFQRFAVDADYHWFTGHEASASQSVDHLRARNDNSRLMIFTTTETRYGDQTDTTLPDLMNASITTPAQFPYIEYIEKLKLTVNKGFKSPETIASIITNQFQNQGEPEVYKYPSEADYGVSALGGKLRTLRPLSVEINSPTYHTFYAGGTYYSSLDFFNAFNNASRDTFPNLHYLSTYQYIGVKRPNLFIKGREWVTYLRDSNINTDILGYGNPEFLETMPKSNFRIDSANVNGSHTIVTDYVWENAGHEMKLLHNIFVEQGKHDELFENSHNQYNGFTTKNNSRFFLMNVMRNDERGTRAGDNFRYLLGCDYYNSNTSGVPYLNSVPVFVDFNPDYEFTETLGESWEEGYSYGVFKKVRKEGVNYVAFTTSHLGFLEADPPLDDSFTTIPNCYFTLNDGDGTTNNASIDSQTMWGWDIHFNSYGNLCYMLYDGYGKDLYKANPQQNFMYPTAYNTFHIGTYLYSQKIYLGADNPKLEFNSTSNKFEISNLHTAERIQNRWNAGGIETDGGTTNLVKEFDTAGNRVWKMNKRLYNNSFTPDMKPYGANSTELRINTTDYAVDLLNPNLEGWTIYDQLSGIIIKDFGFTEQYWDEGLWGRLGFIYSQFNSSRTSLNDLTTRVGNNNKDALPYAFTNANIPQVSTMDFATNVFGAGMYNLQLPITMSFNASNHGVNENEYIRENLDFQNFPEITENATSVKLTAPNLPAKLVNPYYTIRTDVLDDSQYFGGKDSYQPLPIIATIAKSSDYNNFFVSLGGDLEFTFTRPKIISSITTEITDPDGTPSDITGNSAIIYKLTKTFPAERLQVLDTILMNEKKKSKI